MGKKAFSGHPPGHSDYISVDLQAFQYRTTGTYGARCIMLRACNAHSNLQPIHYSHNISNKMNGWYCFTMAMSALNLTMAHASNNTMRIGSCQSGDVASYTNAKRFNI